MKKYITPIFLAFLATTVNAQQNYYISPSGNNANTGSLTTPWKTLQYAINAASTNDTINMLAGTYNEKVNISKSNISIRNYQGAAVLLSGTGITAQVAMIEISNRSNVSINGLEIANNIQLDAQGILVDGAGANITIENCRIHDIHFSSDPGATVSSTKNAQGIIVYGTSGTTPITNIKIVNNQLYNCRLGYSEGIAVNGNVNGFEISGNEVHDITNIGIDIIGHEGTSSSAANDQARNGIVKNNKTYRCLSPYATSGGLYVDGGKSIIIENNISYHNGYGIEIGCENKGKTTDSIIVRNNIFYDNEICAIAVGGYDYPNSGKVSNSIIINNTCYKNDYKNDGIGELYFTYCENSIVENNIFYLSAQNVLAYAELSQPGMKFNYNIFFSDNDPANLEVGWNGIYYNSFAAFKAATSTNANSKIANPQFVNPSIINPDFHIASTSPAKEAGDPFFIAAATERDMDNELRISGIVDCGADEYYAAITTYTFIGNGNWNIATYWSNNMMPPAILSGNAKIIINPSGECILNIEQRLTNGAELVVLENKKFTVAGSLAINN